MFSNLTNLWRRIRGSRSLAASKRLHASRKSRRLFFEPLEDRSLLATIVVTGIGDSIAEDGVVTLREAITAANTNAASGDAPAGDTGLDTINFNIPGSGVHTIAATSALGISDPVTINGYTQPGAHENTNVTGGLNTVLQVELTSSTPGSATGLVVIFTSDVTIKGLVINRFNTAIAVDIGTSNIRIEGNFIGTDPLGTVDLGNGNGVQLNTQLGSAQVIVGGATAAARNLISGNDVFGLTTGGNFNGFNDLTIQGNLIGTDVTGLVAVPNQFGIGVGTFTPSTLVVGGATAAEGNVISGNTVDAIRTTGQGASFTGTIQGNTIGVAADGATPLGNGGNGISMADGPATIGGTSAGEGNLIAFNGQSGVNVLGGHGINISGNSIFSNARLGIDLTGGTQDAFGVTTNDPGDADLGPNNLQNFPEITVAGVAGGTLTIEYAVPSTTANSAYPLRVEFFKADADGQEGMTFLGFDTYTPAESTLVKSVSFTPSAAVTVGDRIVATATDAAKNTSEFSAAQLVSAAIDLAAEGVTIPDAATLGEDVTIDYVVHNLGNAPADGSWIDSLYLSTDELLDSGDPLIGRALHSGGVGAHSS